MQGESAGATGGTISSAAFSSRLTTLCLHWLIAN